MEERTTRRYDERSAERAKYVTVVRKLVQSSDADFMDSIASMVPSDLELMVEKMAFTEADKPDIRTTIYSAHDVLVQCRGNSDIKLQIDLARAAINGVLKHYIDQESLGRSINSLGVINTNLQATKEELQKSNADLHFRAHHDVFTGLKNRAYFMDEMARVIKEADKYMLQRKMPVSIVLCDLDGLKDVNDGYSHDAGDKYITAFITRARSALHDRPEDTFARIGGDEFALLLPLTDEFGATIVASRIHRNVTATPLMIDAETSIDMSVSIGVWQHVPGEQPDDALKQADACMYVGKKFRNKGQVVSGQKLIPELLAAPGDLRNMQETYKFPAAFLKKVAPKE
jgi:diguanylate cyclase (GGDEF)-like protein